MEMPKARYDWLTLVMATWIPAIFWGVASGFLLVIIISVILFWR